MRASFLLVPWRPAARGARGIFRSFASAAPALATVGLLSVGGCASGGGPVVRNESFFNFDAGTQNAYAAFRSVPYRIQPGDLLGVFSLHNDIIKQPEVLVLPDGSAGFVGIDRLEVAGLTVSAVDSMLTQRYAAIVRESDLSVVVVKSVGNQVYVLGDVRNPDLYNVPPQGFGVLGAITLAGGFADGAKRGSVVLIRLTPTGYMCRELNLSGVQAGGAFDVAVADLRPYDIIYVSRSAIGDFVAFSKDVVGVLSNYTRLIYDVRAIQDPLLYRR